VLLTLLAAILSTVLIWSKPSSAALLSPATANPVHPIAAAEPPTERAPNLPADRSANTTAAPKASSSLETRLAAEAQFFLLSPFLSFLP